MKFKNILSSSAVVAVMVAAGVVTFNEPASSQRCRESYTLRPERNSLEFHRGVSWRTCSGYNFTLQNDGNLVLYNRRGRDIWSVGRNRRGDLFAVQHDGNVVLYGRSRAIWDTGTAGNRGASFAIQGDGNLVVYSRSNRVLWASHTAGR